MSSDADFHIAHNFLQSLGCRITQYDHPQQKPSTSSVSAGSDNSFSHRPLTTATSFQDMSQRIESHQPLISQMTRGAEPRGSWMQQSSSDRPSTGLASVHAGRSFTAPYSSSSQHQDSCRPIARDPPERYAVYDRPGSFTAPSPPRSGTGSRHLPSREDDLRAMPPPSRTGRSIQSDPVVSPLSGQHMENRAYTDTRPATADVQSVSQMIPPRRELSFSRSLGHGSRPSSSSLALPPLPTPTLAGENSEVSNARKRQSSAAARPDVYTLPDDVDSNGIHGMPTLSQARRDTTSFTDRARPVSSSMVRDRNQSDRHRDIHGATNVANATAVPGIGAPHTSSSSSMSGPIKASSSDPLVPRSSPPPNSVRQHQIRTNNSNLQAAYSDIDVRGPSCSNPSWLAPAELVSVKQYADGTRTWGRRSFENLPLYCSHVNTLYI